MSAPTYARAGIRSPAGNGFGRRPPWLASPARSEAGNLATLCARLLSLLDQVTTNPPTQNSLACRHQATGLLTGHRALSTGFQPTP